MGMDPKPSLYRPKDAAVILGVSRTMVYDLMRDGLLPYVRIGADRRIRAVDLTAYIDSLAVNR